MLTGRHTGAGSEGFGRVTKYFHTLVSNDHTHNIGILYYIETNAILTARTARWRFTSCIATAAFSHTFSIRLSAWRYPRVKSTDDVVRCRLQCERGLCIFLPLQVFLLNLSGRSAVDAELPTYQRIDTGKIHIGYKMSSEDLFVHNVTLSSVSAVKRRLSTFSMSRSQKCFWSIMEYFCGKNTRQLTGQVLSWTFHSLSNSKEIQDRLTFDKKQP